MKKLFLAAFLCLLFSGGLRAQVGVQVSYIAPTGGYQYILKRTVGAELLLPTIKDLDEQLNFFLSAGIYFYRPTADTFRTVTITTETGRGPVIPSTQVIRYAIAIPLGFSTEYRFIDGPLSPMAGAEADFYLVELNMITNSAYISSSGSETYWTTGITPKAGVAYHWNDEWLFTAGIGRSFGIIGIVHPQVHFKTFIRAIRTF
jgi:hypothetical protein